MIIGDCWAEHCTIYLQKAVGEWRDAPDGLGFAFRGFVRLDDNPEVEREANLNQLANPDFLLVGDDGAGGIVVQAADAKFAADRIKPNQVSVNAVDDLLRIPERGATRAALQQQLHGTSLDEIRIVPGVFLAPDSELTDLLLERSPQRDGSQPEEVIARVPLDSGRLFATSDPAVLIPTLARADRLPVSPQRNLLAAVYYLRVACASLYFWAEQTRPLFGDDAGEVAPGMGMIAAETSNRLAQASSAFGMLVEWHRDLRAILMARKSVSDAAALPVSMVEIRERVSAGPNAQHGVAVRRARKELEIYFRTALQEQIGVIYPDDPRSLDRIAGDVRLAARRLRPSLLDKLDEVSGY